MLLLKKWIGPLAALGAVAALGACQTPSGAGGMTLDALSNMAESGSYEALGPAGNAAEIMMKSPEIAKAALIVTFERKRDQAGVNNDFDKADFYQDNIDCLHGNCAGLRAREAKRIADARRAAQATARRAGAPSRPAAPPMMEKGGEGGGGGGGGGGSH